MPLDVRAIAPARAAVTILTALVASSGCSGGGTGGSAGTATGETVVSLAFDDGNADQYATRSVLAAHGMHATFFVNSGRLGTPGHLSWQQVQDLAGDGNEIGGHTLDHVDLLTLDLASRTHQICDDRAALLARGLTATSFAYPFADVDAQTEQIVSGCGYAWGRGEGRLATPVTCLRCPFAETIPPGDPYHIRTPDSVKDSMTLADIEGYVTQAEDHGGGWVIVIFHHLCDHCDPYAVSMADLTAFLDWLQPRTGRRTVVETLEQVKARGG